MTLGPYESYLQSLYPQTTMGLDVRFPSVQDTSIFFDNNSGDYGGILFTNGKIIDTNNKMLYAFNYSQPLDLRVEIENGLYSAWVDDSLICASQSLFPSPSDYIVSFSFISYASGNLLDVKIRGELPYVEYGPLYTDDLINFTGYIQSSGLPISIIGNVTPNTLTAVSYPTGLFTSGQYTLSGHNLSSGNIEDIYFEFDFGNVTTGVPVVYNDPNIASGYLNVTFGPVIDDTITRDGDIIQVQYQDVSVLSSWAYDTTLQYYIEYVGRSGEQIVNGTGIGSGYYSGYIEGSGYLYSTNLEGIIYPQAITGYGSGSLYAYTTGTITYEYIIDVVGIESGQSATGVLWGELTGIVGYSNSGVYLFNQNITGTPSVSVWGGGTFISPTGQYTGNVTHLSILSQYTTVYGSGDFQGTGIVEDLSGSISGFNLITGSVYELYNFDYQYTYDNLYNLKELGYYFGNKIQDPLATSLYDGVYSFGIRIGYERSAAGLLTDHANFNIVNNFTGYSFPIIGETL